jgi:hypothetical protein
VTVDTGITERLIGVLRSATGTPDLEYDRRPEPMRGGFWAELFAFSLANPPGGWPAELVARLMPDPGSARKETIVQRAVAAAGFPTPIVRAAGSPDDGLGVAFMVMDRAPGGPALSGLDGLSPAAVPRLLREIPDLLATSMGRLHALDPGLVRAELERLREVPVTVEGLLAALVRFADTFGRTDLADAGRWLAAHPPGPSPDVIWVEPAEVRWHQAVVCLRALVEVASWVHEGAADARAGHPWLINGPVFARRLVRLTGAPVRAR